MKNRAASFLSALTLACAAGYGCGSEVNPTGSTGTGGSATSSGEGVVSSSSVGGAGGGVTAVSSGSGSGSGSSGGGGGGGGGGGSGGGSSSGSTGSSSGSSSSGSSSSGSSSSGSSSSTGGGAGNGAVLAVRKFFYGDTNFDDTANKVNGWKQYGFNLDGKVSTSASVDLCKLGSGAPSSVHADGNGGIDNSFGKNILPIFLALSASLTDKANQAITDGHYTLIFDLEGLGATADQAPLVSKVYSGTTLSAPPKFDGSDLWPVAPEGLTNPADIASAKPVFPMSGVVANHWDSGPTGATVRLQIELEGVAMTLDLLGARVAMDLDPDHQGAQTGHLGGVIATTQLVAEMKRVIGTVDPSLCSGATVDSIVGQFQQASDSLLDGTQDPAKACDGVSIGLGFKARAVVLGGIGPAAPPPQQPCAP